MFIAAAAAILVAFALAITRARGREYRNRNLRAEVDDAFATGPAVHNMIVGATVNKRFQTGATSPAASRAGQSFFGPDDVSLPAPPARSLR